MARSRLHGVRFALPSALLTTALLAARCPAEESARVAPDDAHLQYVGRFDRRDPAGPRCEWPASSVVVRFRGTGLSAEMADTSDGDAFEVVIDGKPAAVLRPGRGTHTIEVAKDLPAGEHTVELVKRTEAVVGRAQFRGFVLPAGTALLDPRPATRRIEVIGDSISCGYGNEAASEKLHFDPATENAYLAYGAVAAWAVDAQYVCVAWSGKKVWPDNALPDLYDLALPTDPASRWDFSAPPPDVVLINLATNDFNPKPPDADQWTAAYAAFVRRVRGHYPKALIYLASGTMMSDAWPPGQKAMTTLLADLDRVLADLNKGGDTNVRLLPFGSQDAQADGLGADYHPSVKTDAKMAEKFVVAMQRDLGYAPVPQK